MWPVQFTFALLSVKINNNQNLKSHFLPFFIKVGWEPSVESHCYISAEDAQYV